MEKALEQHIEELNIATVSLADEAKGMKIQNDSDAEQATELIVAIKSRLKNVEELRKFFTQPLYDQQKRINEKFKQATAPMLAIEAEIKKELGDYQLRQLEEARRKDEELLKKQAEDNVKKLVEGEPLDPTPVALTERPETSRKTDAGSVTFIEKWKFEVVEPNEVPYEFCKPDEAVIREAVASGVREIAGVRIYKDIETRVSSK